MWGHGKTWLEAGGCLPREPHQFAQDLTAPKVGYAGERQIQLERKEEMEARGVPSPHWGDAWSFTFARPVLPRARPPRPRPDDWTARLARGLDQAMDVRAARRLPDAQVFDIHFAEFMADQIGMVRRLYEHFGL